MRRSWNKGLTKETHPSVQKISETMRARKIDNFAVWRAKAAREGKIKSSFPMFRKSGDLAELIGVVLGDGHIEKFPRTERLLIFSNSNNPGFVQRYARLVHKVFQKAPYVYKQSNQNCIRISLYEKEISRRLGVPVGARKNLHIAIPAWIEGRRAYLIRYLRGLYEAEGCLAFHAGTHTHKLIFSNTNQSMLKNVVKSLTVLGFSPHSDSVKVQLSRKEEVKRAAKLLRFRVYED